MGPFINWNFIIIIFCHFIIVHGIMVDETFTIIKPKTSTNSPIGNHDSYEKYSLDSVTTQKIYESEKESVSEVSEERFTTVSDILVETTTVKEPQEITDRSTDKLCAFVSVSHNSSYAILDREEYSVGLEKIHNTSDIFEKFISIDIEDGCEATICKLQLLNQSGRKRSCISINSSQPFETEKVADPITAQYFVSTGCSCKEPSPKCQSATCNNQRLKDNECALLFKETSCTECRYDRHVLKPLESFYPTNGFWCQSFIIRDGCRLSIDSSNATGQFNVRNYTEVDSNVALDYVRYPYPSKLSCFCDMQRSSDIINEQRTESWILAVSISAAVVLLILIVATVLRKCVSIKVERKISKDQLENLVLRFKHGFSKDSHEIDVDAQNNYVSVGYMRAIEQPYQHKWEIQRSKITIDKSELPLGSGQFGSVHKGILRTKLNYTPGLSVAIKIAKTGSSINNLISVLDEIKILAYVGKHPNICGLVGACTDRIPEKDALILLELCSEGNLKNYLKKNKSAFVTSNSPTTVHYVMLSHSGYATLDESGANLKPASSPTIKPANLQLLIKIAKQIACGMEFLSFKQVIHADLAARNVLLTDTLDCKIADFGLSQRLHEEAINYVRMGSDYPLPFRWMSLESLTDLKFTIQSDIWSYGVVLFELFTLGDDPFPNFGLSDLITMLKCGKRLGKPIYSEDNVYDVMLKCWDADMSKRPSFGQLKFLFESM